LEKLSIDFILKSVNGTLFNENPSLIEISSISTDSREIKENSLFIPLIGKTFDGHYFIEKAFENKASISLSSRKLNTDKPYIKVNDTLNSLHCIAKDYLRTLNLGRICITGSTGKTTIKNLLSSSIIEKETVSTEGNTNNLIGVPYNIFRCSKNTKYAVFEMGINMKGELKTLSEITRPTHIIITSVNNSHIGNFKSFEDIIDTKLEIFSGYENLSSPVIINGDNKTVIEKIRKFKHVTFGLGSKNDFQPENLTILKNKNEIEIESKKYTISIPGIGGVYAFLAVYAFMRTFPEISIDIEKGLENFIQPESRMNIFQLSGLTLIDDSYNASPASMANAIDVLSKFSARKVAILSDMLELGAMSDELHKNVGEELNSKEIDVLIAVGDYSKKYFEVFKKEKYYFIKREDMEKKIFFILNNKDIVLIKGSHSTRMDETAKLLKEHYNVV